MKKSIIYLVIAFMAFNFACSPVRTKTASRKSASASTAPREIPDQKVKKEKKQVSSKKSKDSDKSPKPELQPDSLSKTSDQDPKQRKRVFISTKNRFVDTTLIEYATTTEIAPIALQMQISDAMKSFDKEDYSKACSKIQQFSETIVKGDSIYFESMFLWSECLIIQDDLVKAEKILKEILADKRVTENVLEKSLVRLGQIYCVKGEKTKAETLFNRLRLQFPSSIYIPLANCDAVK